MRIPDSPVPLNGYRVWALGRDGLLRSSASGFTHGIRSVWRPRERFNARCLSLRPCEPPAVPGAGHTCGIYAVSHLGTARAWARSLGIRPLVIGEVWGWGRVVQTERGWRARHAYPAALVEVIGGRLPGRRAGPPALAALGAAYGIPVLS